RGVSCRQPFSPGEPTTRSPLLAGLLSCAALAAEAPAREYSPRVVAPSVADTYSLKTFAQHHRWRHLKGDARAWAMFCYLTDRQPGLFPLGQPVHEGADLQEEYRTVRDPVKLLNVYGYGFCGILGPVMAGIAEGADLGPARTLILPGWHHVAAETFYAGKW